MLNGLGPIIAGGIIVFGGAAFALGMAIRRTKSLPLQILLGLFLLIFGLIALGFGACGVMILGA